MLLVGGGAEKSVTGSAIIGGNLVTALALDLGPIMDIYGVVLDAAALNGARRSLMIEESIEFLEFQNLLLFDLPERAFMESNR